MLLMKMSKKYWVKRFEQEEERNVKVSLKEMQVAKREYQKAITSIDDRIRSWYSKYATENGLSYQDAQKQLSQRDKERLTLSLEEYIRLGERQNLKFNASTEKLLKKTSAEVHINRLESIKNTLQAELNNLYSNIDRGLGNHFNEVLSEGYARTSYLVQSISGNYETINAINKDLVNKVIYKPWTNDSVNWSSRIWKQKDKLVEELHTTLTQSLLLGDDINLLADKVAKRMDVGFSRAANLLMTESAAYHSKATELCYKDLEVEKYEILATLDNRTSAVCQGMDGKIFDRKDYKVGITAPPFHCRCRTTTIPYFEDMIEDETRAGRDENGDYVEEKASIKYQEWKEKYYGFIHKENFNVEIKEMIEKEFGALNTTEVILRPERLKHIEERHSEVTSVLKEDFVDIVKNPDYILKDNKHEDTIWNVMENKENKSITVIKLSLAKKEENKKYKNSIITMYILKEKRLNSHLKSKKILYKKKEK